MSAAPPSPLAPRRGGDAAGCTTPGGVSIVVTDVQKPPKMSLADLPHKVLDDVLGSGAGSCAKQLQSALICIVLLLGAGGIFLCTALAPDRNMKWDARHLDPEVPHTMSYYLKCMVGGVLGCGLTHTFVGPLDVIKCAMQMEPGRYTSTIAGLRVVYQEEGLGGLTKGMSHMVVGYGTQGMFKFSLYELFKDSLLNFVGRDVAMMPVWRGAVFLIAASCAEVLADLPMCPMEMTKVRVMTAKPGTFPNTLVASVRQMARDRERTGFPFGSIGAIWARQIPYTAAKFFTFEWCVSQIYSVLLTHPRDSYSKGAQLLVTFLAGYLSGIACTVVSHPADSLISLRAKPGNAGRPYMQIAREVGWWNLWTQGLGTRILMVGTLTGIQWWIYDRFKVATGLKTSGTGAIQGPGFTPAPTVPP